jgi:hypothetical protein
MVGETADEPVQRCVRATREGADFPTVWEIVLRGHSLVVGQPVQSVEDGRACLKICIITGQWLVFDSGPENLACFAGSWSIDGDAHLCYSGGTRGRIEARKHTLIGGPS